MGVGPQAPIKTEGAIGTGMKICVSMSVWIYGHAHAKKGPDDEPGACTLSSAGVSNGGVSFHMKLDSLIPNIAAGHVYTLWGLWERSREVLRDINL